MDYGSGPVRNEIQKAVWDAARKLRADMPQVLVTCIDVPIDASHEVVNSCLQSPLNEYRELMYHDGTWYTPAVYNSSKLAQWMSNNEKETKTKGIAFDRKKFEWNTKPYENSYLLGWKSVLEVKAPAPVPQRTDLVFTGPASQKAAASIVRGPSSAECTFQKMLVAARESGDSPDAPQMLEAARCYISRAHPREKASLNEAIEVCNMCVNSIKDAEEAFRAKLLVVSAKSVLDVEQALQAAQELQGRAPTPKTELEALGKLLDCFLELGEVDKALEAARAGQASLASKGSEAASGGWNLLAKALEAKGEQAEAATARTSAKTA